MKVPNAEQAVVAEEKITAYLLDPTNPRSRGKPDFFLAFGFTREAPRELTIALIAHVQQYDIMREEVTEHGIRYTVVGALSTPDGRDPDVRSGWIVLHGDDIPRFVTAVPAQRRRS